MPFTQSPIEAAIWVAFVDLQQVLAATLLGSSVFRAAVATWLGILFVRAIALGVGSGAPAMALGRFALVLFYSSLGLGLLRAKGSDDFRPVNARGAAWAETAKVRRAGAYGALYRKTQGLAFYGSIHRGAAGIGALISERVAGLFHDAEHQASPYLLLHTLAQTSAATIDDPKVLTSLNWLTENCADGRGAAVTSATSSYGDLFDLGREECRSRYQSLRQDLKSWAKGRWGSSLANTASLGIQQLGVSLGLPVDEEALQNKMIASAMVNLARSQLGKSSDNVHAKALLNGPGSDSVFGSTTSFFVGLDNALTTAGIANGLVGRLAGIDAFAGDGRNKAASLYNRIVQYLPPIRGYAKGILALAFVFAACGLAFGTPRFMVAWFGMLVLFTAYEPLSTMLYETTMLFAKAQETTEALGALKSDPLVLSGAAIIDDNLARIQAVYFALQLGLAGVCGAGGISIFVFTKRLGGGLADGVVGKVVTAAQTMARAGGSVGA